MADVRSNLSALLVALAIFLPLAWGIVWFAGQLSRATVAAVMTSNGDDPAAFLDSTK